MVKFVDGVVLGAAARACSALGVLFWSSPRRQVAESLLAGFDRAGCRRAIHWRGVPGIGAPRFHISAERPYPSGPIRPSPVPDRPEAGRQWGVAGRQHGRFRILGPHPVWSGHGEPGSLADGDLQRRVLVLVLLKQTPGLVPQTLPLPACPSARRPSCRRNGPAQS